MIKQLQYKSEFSISVLTLMTGTIIAQALPILVSPILTRIYTPEDFGVLALFISIVSILSSIANGKYELALMLPKKDGDALNIFILGIVITFIFSFFLIIICFFFNDYFVYILDNDEIRVWLYFVPITVLFMSSFEMLKFFNNRNKLYKDIATATVLKSLVAVVIQLSGPFIKQGPSGLILGHTISQMFANLNLLKNILNDKSLILSISKKKILVLAKKYKKFPIYFMPTYGLNVISSSLIPILLGSYFSVEIAGLYFLVTRAIKAPLGIISNSIGSVFFQKVSQDNDCRDIYLKISFFLFCIGLLPTIIIYIYASQIFTFVFGDEWFMAGEMASILVIMFYLSFVTIPVSQLSTIKQKALYNVIWQLLLLMGIIFSLVLGILYSSWKLFLIMYVVIQCILYIYGFFYELKLCKSEGK